MKEGCAEIEVVPLKSVDAGFCFPYLYELVEAAVAIN